MPGMMDTVLNLGLNDEVVTGLASKSGERFAYDSYRRFLDMFGDVVSASSRCCSLCYLVFSLQCFSSLCLVSCLLQFVGQCKVGETLKLPK